MKINYIILAVLSGLLFSCSHDRYPKKLIEKIKQGDLIFENIDCGDICNSINDVTKVKGFPQFNHVAMVYSVQNGKIVLIEAYTNGVSKISFDKFVARAKRSSGKAQIAVARVKKPEYWKIPLVLHELKMRLGKPYDDKFLPDNGAYYCSELIADSFASAGLPLFKRIPMFFGFKNDKSFKIWKKYFESKGYPFPEGVPGTNPVALLTSSRLKIIYNYK